MLLTRFALAVAAAVLGLAATASADLRSPMLGERDDALHGARVAHLQPGDRVGRQRDVRRLRRADPRRQLTARAPAKPTYGSVDVWGNAEAARRAPRR
jgi:hypothetical protein